MHAAGSSNHSAAPRPGPCLGVHAAKVGREHVGGFALAGGDAVHIGAGQGLADAVCHSAHGVLAAARVAHACGQKWGGRQVAPGERAAAAARRRRQEPSPCHSTTGKYLVVASSLVLGPRCSCVCALLVASEPCQDSSRASSAALRSRHVISSDSRPADYALEAAAGEREMPQGMCLRCDRLGVWAVQLAWFQASRNGATSRIERLL